MTQYHLEKIIAHDRLTELSRATAMSCQESLVDDFLDLPLWDPFYDLPLFIDDQGQCVPEKQLPTFMKPPWVPFGVGFHRFLTLAGEFRDGGYQRGAFFDEAKRGFWRGLSQGLQKEQPGLHSWVVDKNNAGLIQKAVCMGVMMDAFFLVNNDPFRHRPAIYRAEILIEALPTLLEINYVDLA
jgi:hypothetical protein